MAFILLTNNKALTLTHDQAMHLERVRKGLEAGSPKQQAFARKVKRVYLGRQYDVQPQPSRKLPNWQD